LALLVGILLPALASARRNARTAACLSNARQMALAMTTYANEWKDSFPVLPIPPTMQSRMFLEGQWAHGGVASLFSLYQTGDGADPGFQGLTGNPASAAYVNG